MASRVMHLAVLAELNREMPPRNPDRLALGVILPDGVATKADQRASHLKITLPDGRKTYDLTGFRQQFGPALVRDELYLGYYLHLVQDLVYRQFVYGRHHWVPTPENVARLHRDYQLLNGPVHRRYPIPETLELPAELNREPLLTLAAFRPEQLLEALRQDAAPEMPGTPFFLTPEMAEEYIAMATEVCRAERQALQSGTTTLDEVRWSWRA